MQNNIRVKEALSGIKDLSEFDAAFFSGTSPKILPIRRISDIRYKVSNPLMRLLMNAYDDLIKSYVKS